MGILYTMGTFTGNTNGTLQGVDYTPDLEAISANVGFLVSAINNLVIALDGTMLGVTASTVPGTIAASAAAVAGTSVAQGKLSVENAKQLEKLIGSMTAMSKQLSGISSTVASGVATNQIIAADQIKKNAFDKEATQAALKRNNLPEVTVTPTNFLEGIRTAVLDAGNIASTASVTGFLTTTAGTAITNASNYVSELLPSFGDITNAFKGLLPAATVDPAVNAVRTDASALTAIAQTKILG